MLYNNKFKFVLYSCALLQLTSNIKTENLELKAEVQYKIKNGIPRWMQKQISEDLSLVPKSGVTKEMITETLKQDHMCVLFKIKNGQINVEHGPYIPGDYFGGIGVMFEVLNELNSYMPLPDVEFIYSVDDSPFNRVKLESFNQTLNPSK